MWKSLERVVGEIADDTVENDSDYKYAKTQEEKDAVRRAIYRNASIITVAAFAIGLPILCGISAAIGHALLNASEFGLAQMIPAFLVSVAMWVPAVVIWNNREESN